MPLNRRELLFGLVGKALGLNENIEAAEKHRSVFVTKGQFTPYGTSNDLMNWQVLYRCGLNLNISDSSVMKLLLQNAKSLNDLKNISGMVVSEELADTIIPRLPGGLDFVKSVFAEDRPYLVAPDTADLDKAVGVQRNPWDYIGREVILQKQQKIIRNGEYHEVFRHAPAYIFDVMAPEHRELPVNNNFFCDADPNTYEKFLGIRVHDSEPFLRTIDGHPINELPYVSLRFNPQSIDRES